jgi:chemosensory pili system protein ChpA (sensor histidine kinase/response regulator)
MDKEIIEGFIEEAESYLPALRGGILICSQEGRYHDALETSRRQAHTIKGAAMMVGLENIGKIAADLEAEISALVAERRPPTGDESRSLLDRVAQIEAILVKQRFGAEDFTIDVSDFVEVSFENLQFGDASDASQVEEILEAEVWEDFEIDDEMREVFALEAEELLRNIGANLERLEKLPNDREALLEIRRSAHTLKGSAGILGFKTISELAHHVEDLLDYLSENEIEGNRKVFQLLLSSNDCLNALVSDGDSPALSEQIKSLASEFEAIKKSLQEPAAAPVEFKPELVPTSKVAALVREPSSSGNQNRSVIRVSLDKLDDLVRIVSEMVISRSVFEQRLTELSMQIEELQNSTRRLSHSTGKLEIDFEADMLGSARRFNQPPFGFSLNKAGDNDLLEFDSLEFDRYTEFHQTTRELVETTGDTFAINTELENLRGNLEILFDRQRRLIEEMQDKLLRLRMVAFGSLTNRLQRTVRVTAEQDAKQVELVIYGEQLEVDTQILDSLIEPLLHLLRNAVAHGIENPDTRRLLGKPETGRIELRIYSEGLHIIVNVRDDGRGISTDALKKKAVLSGAITPEQAAAMTDEEALKLIFLPGLTTTEEINYVSGRGVGMNIVQTAIERQQGTITVHSEAQKGTEFTIRLPMSLAITRALLVKSNDQIYAFPLNLVKKITEIPAEKIAKNERSWQEADGTNYRLTHLNNLLGLPAPEIGHLEKVPLLLIETLEQPHALAVDEVIKAEEIVIKPLDRFLQNIAEFVGATILGDGSVVPVLDLIYLLGQQDRKNERSEPPAPAPPPEKEKQTQVMIVDDSPSVRLINSKLIKNAGMTPHVARDGLEALELLQSLQELPDVILTDVEMPRMDGYELLASLKKMENLRSIPVIMITSRTSDKHREKAFELGVSEYLTKPYEDAKLIEAIKTLAA